MMVTTTTTTTTTAEAEAEETTNERGAKFLTSIFKKYYYDNISSIPAPDYISNREFGYQKFDMSGMMRHIQIKDKAEMRVSLLRNAPSDVYCSNARYMFPNLEMSQKNWQGADLIFDIDAKDLELPCRKNHVVHVCVKCNKVYKYDALSFDADESKNVGAQHNHNNNNKTLCCSICDDGGNIKQKSLPCKKCTNASKIQVRRLIDTLRNDLGVSEDEIITYFSGNEGFHVHVTHAAFFDLDSRARIDLADYLTLRGLIPESLGMKKTGPDKKNFVDIGEAGWRGMLAKSMFGSRANRTALVEELAKSPEAGYARFRDMLRDAVSETGIRIDSGVTTDVSRVFRMPHTLNSKSGMLKMPCTRRIDSFDPYTDAVVLSIYDNLTVEVKIDCPIKFEICGKKYGPYTDSKKQSIPTSVAVYLLCKGLATIQG